ncbi:putative bifunctional diguanylate cyclase/phosphodiesterase [Paenibacillus sp. GCM10023252]|uniref:putative bifunctional diguanylate cyclase/phosphodiesterase n=1 Tax=Paenibacillus sp. GCM10023252 TaxID=3252649 RepID=UPI0036080647
MIRTILSAPRSKWSVAYLACLLLALLSVALPLNLSYGITFSFTSISLLLIMRIHGFYPGMLAAAAVYSTAVFLLGQPLFTFIGLLEVTFVGLALRSRPAGHLLSWDALFWLVLGLPLSCIMYHLTISISTLELCLYLIIIAANGLLNAILADILDTYLPIRYWSGISKLRRQPVPIRVVLTHLLIVVIALPFLFNSVAYSRGSYETTMQYSYRLAANTVSSIHEELASWRHEYAIPEGVYGQKELRYLQSVVNKYTSEDLFHIMIFDSDHTLLAADFDNASAVITKWNTMSKMKPLQDNFYLLLPQEDILLLNAQEWHDGRFIYNSGLDEFGLSVVISIPIRSYQQNIFNQYMDQLVYVLCFAFLALIVAIAINRWLVRSFTRLAAASSNLPDKLQVMDTMEWPSSSILEVSSLTHNFKQMAHKLVQMFHESQQINNRLQIQTMMLQRSEEELHQLAYYDNLTGLPNRLQFATHLQELLFQEDGSGLQVAVMFGDLNRFKQINDTLGHAAGDELLKLAGQRFLSAAAEGCQVFRLGGDEFVFVMAYSDEQVLQGAVDLICESLGEPILVDGKQLYVSLSLGISLYPKDGEDLDTLVMNADMAMYKAKEQGTTSYRYFEQDLISELTERMQVENGLRNALHENQFSLYYQPKISSLSGKLSGIEALIRWHHPDLGMIPPDKFIPLAEESGFILEIDSWVFLEACRQNKTWQDEGMPRVPVSVNISARHFNQGDLVGMIEKALADTKLEPKYISIEITEGVLIRNVEQVIATIGHLRCLGIQISIDDFGTGYSSLNQLQRLPISDVKLDRSFIQGISTDVKKSSIVQAVIALVHSMNMKVVAEGIETEEEADYFTRLNCDELQGYLFSRPLPREEFERFVRGESAVRG